jgi:hypothetical protein
MAAKEKEMKGRKWAILVVVLLLLFSVGCATGAATSAKPPTNIGYDFGGGYRNVSP